MVWFKRCAIILAVAAALAAADSFARPSAWTAKSPPKKTEAPIVAATATATDGTTQTVTPQAAVVVHDAKWFSDQLEAGAVAIDARTAEKFRESRVPGAIHLPFEAFTKGRPEALDFLPDDGTQMIIYCDGGDCDASHKVQTMLAQYGLTSTIVFEAGFPGWQQAGLEVESGDPASQ